MSSSEASVSTVEPRAWGSPSSGEEWVIEPRSAGLLTRAREVWRYRHLLRYFALTTLQRTYKTTALGWVWLLIRPLFGVVVGTLVFHGLVGVDSGEIPYFLFYLVGSSIWEFFDESLMWTTRSLQLHRGLLTKLYFPRIILPVATISPALLNFGIHLGLILVVSLYFLLTAGKMHLNLGFSLLLAPAGLALCFLTVLAVGLFTSVWGAEKPDVRLTLRYVSKFWFFLTPVIYPLSAVPEDWRWLAAINPVTPIVQLFRWGILGTDEGLSPAHLVAPFLVLAATLAAGFWYFSKAEAQSIDRL